MLAKFIPTLTRALHVRARECEKYNRRKNWTIARPLRRGKTRPERKKPVSRDWKIFNLLTRIVSRAVNQNTRDKQFPLDQKYGRHNFDFVPDFLDTCQEIEEFGMRRFLISRYNQFPLKFENTAQRSLTQKWLAPRFLTQVGTRL